MTNKNNIEIGTYRHTKPGKLYEVIGTALNTETEQELVIYRPLYDCDHEMFARPFDMFKENVEINGFMQRRFQKVNEKLENAVTAPE